MHVMKDLCQSGVGFVTCRLSPRSYTYGCKVNLVLRELGPFDLCAKNGVVWRCIPLEQSYVARGV